MKSGQKGFIFLPFLLANWQLIAIGLLVLSGYLYYKHCESVKAEYVLVIAEAKRLGAEQEKKTQEIISRNIREKEKADSENSRLRKSNAALSRSLRESRSRGQFLPPAPSGAKRPERACIDRAEFERALQRLDERVSGLIEEGDKARIDLDTAKDWAQ